jgi:hypothetical protein
MVVKVRSYLELLTMREQARNQTKSWTKYYLRGIGVYLNQYSN